VGAAGVSAAPYYIGVVYVGVPYVGVADTAADADCTRAARTDSAAAHTGRTRAAHADTTCADTGATAAYACLAAEAGATAACPAATAAAPAASTAAAAAAAAPTLGFGVVGHDEDAAGQHGNEKTCSAQGPGLHRLPPVFFAATWAGRVTMNGTASAPA